MQSEQPFLREVRWAQFGAFTLIILALLNIGITTALHRNQIDGVASIVLLAVLGYWSLFGLLTWHLGKRRAWARKILLVLAYLHLFGTSGLILQLALVGPIQGDLLYRVYYYAQGIVFGLVSAFLVTSLAKPSVRNACHRQRESTSTPNVLQRAR